MKGHPSCERSDCILAAAAAGLLAVTATATAVSAAAAASPVLTRNALAGPPANPGDLLTSSLTPGTTLSLTTTAGGGVGLFCQQSTWSGPLLANPPAPGGTAAIRVANMTISACTDNSPTVINVTGVAVGSLPGILQVTSVPSYPLRLLPGPGPLVLTVNLLTTAGPVVCTYVAPVPINGNTAAGLQPWRFVNQPFKIAGGPLPACGAAPFDYLLRRLQPPDRHHGRRRERVRELTGLLTDARRHRASTPSSNPSTPSSSGPCFDNASTTPPLRFQPFASELP